MNFMLTSDRRFAFGEATYPNGGLFGPVQQAYLSLFVIHEGHAVVELDDREIVLTAGQCCLVLNIRRLALRCERGTSTRVSWCENRPAVALETLQLEFLGLPEQLPLSPRIESLQKMGVELGLTEASAVNEFRNAIGEALFSAYFLEARTAEIDRPVPRSVLRARRCAEENFTGDCDLAMLAKAAHTSPQYLVSAFRKHLGVTPSRYVWRLRAVRGLNLLQQTGLTISEIAYQCGYKNPYHFSRQIRQFFHRSPSELRKSRGYIDASGVVEGAPDIYY